MKEIRVAIIGCGIIAHTHMKAYGDLEGVKVVACCDINEAKLNAFADKYNIEYRYTDYRELLKRDDLDGVDVALHNNLHAPISIDVMASGKNCYCEKPMAGSYADAVAMKKARDAFGVKLHIQLAMLYGGEMICAKKLIDKGYLGHIYHARSYGYRRMGRPFVDGYGEKEFDSTYWAGHGALYDMGVYHISQLLYLLGLPKVLRVSGSVYQEMEMNEQRRTEGNFGVEELGVGFIKFENDLTMDMIESWAIHAEPFPMSSIHGSKGGIQLVQSANPWEKQVKYLSMIEGYPASTIIDVGATELMNSRFEPWHQQKQNSQAHWVSVLRGECEQIDTPEIALQTMLVSEGIFLSHKLGREIVAEEIPELSQSIAIKEQETPFGTLKYREYPFI